MKTFFTNHILILLSKSSILVGGQAVIEGVMMRVPGYISTAVRDPHGDIITKRQAFNALVKKHKYLDLPILRGAISLFEAMKIGHSAKAKKHRFTSFHFARLRTVMKHGDFLYGGHDFQEMS